MNVPVQIQTTVALSRFAPTPRDLMCVAASEGTKGTGNVVLVYFCCDCCDCCFEIFIKCKITNQLTWLAKLPIEFFFFFYLFNCTGGLAEL